MVACMRFDNAIPLPRSEKAAVQVATLAFLALLIVFVLTLLILYILFEGFGLNSSGINTWLFLSLIGAGTLGAGLYQIGNYWAIRFKRFQVIGKTRFQQTFASTAAQLGFGLSGVGVLGLILGQLLSQTVGFFSLLRGLPQKIRGALKRGINRRRLLWALKRYKRFPIYDAPAALMNSASAQAPAILFAAWFSIELAGYYALSMRLLSAPVGLVGSALSQVLLPKLIESRRVGSAGTVMLSSFRLLAGVSFIPFSVVVALAPTVFPELLGASWSGVGKVASWTALWVALQFVYTPLSVFLVCAEAQRLNMAIQVFFFVFRFFPLFFIYVGWLSFDPLVVFSAASALCYVGALFVLARFANVVVKRTVEIIFGELFLGAVSGGVLWMLSEWSKGCALLATIFIGCVYFYRLNRIRLRFSGAVA